MYLTTLWLLLSVLLLATPGGPDTAQALEAPVLKWQREGNPLRFL